MKYNFDWNRDKEKLNIKKHGINFRKASTIFRDPYQLSIICLIISLIRCLLFKNTVQLLKEVDKHNQIIANLHTLDQLEAVGNPVKIKDRGAVIEALRVTREALVVALQTERILRENPKFKPHYFNIDLTSLEVEKTTVKANEYAQLFNDTMQIGVSVQKEMQNLQRKR